MFPLFLCFFQNIHGSVNWAVEYTDCISPEGSDSLNQFPGYDTILSDSEAPVMLGLWGLRSTASLLSLSGLLWPEVVVLVRVLSLGQFDI